MIRDFLIIEVSNTSDMRGVTVSFRPSDRFVLRSEGSKHTARVIFDDIVGDRAALATFWARLDVNDRHGRFSPEHFLVVE
jgi:hypothetical protein